MQLTINIYNNTPQQIEEHIEEAISNNQVNIFDPEVIDKNTLVSLFATELGKKDRSSIVESFISYLREVNK